jgi:hypothetical protein
MIELNKKIKALHQERGKNPMKAYCNLATHCTKEGVVQRRSYKKREKRDEPKEKVDNNQRTIMKNVAAATRQEKRLR